MIVSIEDKISGTKTRYYSSYNQKKKDIHKAFMITFRDVPS